MEQPAARATEMERLQGEVLGWLISKGGSATGVAGAYKPEDGSKGEFLIEDAADADRKWWMLRLHEDTTDGRRVSLALSIPI